MPGCSVFLWENTSQQNSRIIHASEISDILPFRTDNLPKKHPPEVFWEKGILKSFGNFTGKHHCWSLF